MKTITKTFQFESYGESKEMIININPDDEAKADKAIAEIQELRDYREAVNNDNRKYISAWAGGGYNHGPYYKRLRKQKANGKIKTRQQKLLRLNVK